MIIKKMKNENRDLELIKEHENKLKKYRDRIKEDKKKEPSSYKHLAYQVKNPFKGI